MIFPIFLPMLTTMVQELDMKYEEECEEYEENRRCKFCRYKNEECDEYEECDECCH